MSDDIYSALCKVTDSVNAVYKRKLVIPGRDQNMSDVRLKIPCKSYMLTKLFGGGPSIGRVYEIFGDESCLDGNSFIYYEARTIDGKKVNTKGGSIKRLYERFHDCTVPGEPKQGRHLQRKDVVFYVRSVDDSGMVISNAVLDVVSTGKKVCYKVVTESGNCITTTLDHKYLTLDGYKPLSELKVGDKVFIHNNTRVSGRKYYSTRPQRYVKYHPNLPDAVIHDNKTDRDYIYKRGQVARFCYEAFLNNMSYDEYIKFLNTQSKQSIDNLNFLPDSIHVHHKDEDFTNNEISNLQLIDPSEHGKLHSRDRLRNLSFIVVESSIVSIEKEEVEKDTFDIKCAFPYNNYIADGVVVHNCAKSTLAQDIMIGFQQYPGISVLIDSEFTWHRQRAIAMGHNPDRHVHFQIKALEEGIDVLDTFITRIRTVGNNIPTNMPIVIVWDTISNSGSESEVNEDDEYKEGMTSKPRKLRQLERKWSAKLPEMMCTLVFISQTYTGPTKGKVFGAPPKMTSGGGAIKFWASKRLQLHRGGSIDYPEDGSGIVVCAKSIKDKEDSPYREVDLPMMFKDGISNVYELINFIIDNDTKKEFMYKDRGVVVLKDYPTEGNHESFYYKQIEPIVSGNPELMTYLKCVVDTLWDTKYRTVK